MKSRVFDSGAVTIVIGQDPGDVRVYVGTSEILSIDEIHISINKTKADGSAKFSKCSDETEKLKVDSEARTLASVKWIQVKK